MTDSKDDPTLTRRELLIGAASAAYLAGCKKDYWGKVHAEPGGDDDQIVRAEIHPGIGIARLGNSASEMFVGPEVVDPAPTAAGASRDAAGALKRQAARFRIYGYNAAGQIVRELTADTADIDWFVQLANKKAAWYRFVAAMDLPESATLAVPRRNAKVAQRKSLVAGGNTKTIKGKSITGPAYRFDTSLFGVAFSLGEVRTDDAGRLLVLGGLGQSGSPTNAPIYDEADADTFNNADGWFDDTADGPVSAVVRLGGRQIPVEPAWVVVAPPNYAPDVVGWRTMHDLLVDTFVDAGQLAMPPTTSFTKDVLPALRRLANLQWVNQGFANGYARGGQFDFDSDALLAKLNSKAVADQPLRKQMQGMFRPAASQDRKTWPWLYGDGYGTYSSVAEDNLQVSKLRTLHLQRWADGNFLDDWTANAAPIRTIDQVPLGEQPAMLDRAALHFCLADAFHPGCELTWTMRHISLYSAPFRIKRRQDADAEPDYGATLTQAATLAANGPLNAQSAGDLTRWMAIPWQGDTVFCRSGYEPEYDPYLPTFWPARVPNHVLTAADYAIAIDPTRSRAERLTAFKNRESWVRAMTGNPPAQMLQMVRDFGKLGVVEARPGVANDPDLPAQMFVESLPPSVQGLLSQSKTKGVGGGSRAPGSVAASAPAPGGGAPGGAAPGSEPTSGGSGGAAVRVGGAAQSQAQRAGWSDEAQLEAFRRIRVRRR